MLLNNIGMLNLYGSLIYQNFNVGIYYCSFHVCSFRCVLVVCMGWGKNHIVIGMYKLQSTSDYSE